MSITHTENFKKQKVDTTTNVKLSLKNNKDERLPVTLLSGFLGSGKTTLLHNILMNRNHGLRCAIIVNDMSSLNIDAALVEQHKLTQAGEKMIQMQNGCICCTLREDLLEQIVLLTEEKKFDYLIIESTGISEPMQVAETFSFEFLEEAVKIEEEISRSSTKDKKMQSKMASLLSKGGLPTVARLDTCVTVVDAMNVLNDFSTTDFITDRPNEAGEEVDPQDERNVTDLLVDQIEFADVVLINKCDLAPSSVVKKVKALIQTLNPRAKVIESVKCNIDLQEILNTGKFSFEEAVIGAGWLQSLKEMMPVDTANGQKNAPKPETEEYGISNFVYRRRRPFHPKRLSDLLEKYFILIQDSFEGQEGEEEEGEGEGEEGEENENDDENDEEKDKLNANMKLAEKKNSKAFKSLFRSKGFIWLATRPYQSGELSQAGVMLTVSGGQNWFCTTPEEEWDVDGLAIKAIKADFDGEFGDRRQELVFIGGGEEKLNVQQIEKDFDACLLTDDEYKTFQNIMRDDEDVEQMVNTLIDNFEDNFEDWINPDDELGEDEHGHDHKH